MGRIKSKGFIVHITKRALYIHKNVQNLLIKENIKLERIDVNFNFLEDTVSLKVDNINGWLKVDVMRKNKNKNKFIPQARIGVGSFPYKVKTGLYNLIKKEEDTYIFKLIKKEVKK